MPAKGSAAGRWSEATFKDQGMQFWCLFLHHQLRHQFDRLLNFRILKLTIFCTSYQFWSPKTKSHTDDASGCQCEQHRESTTKCAPKNKSSSGTWQFCGNLRVHTLRQDTREDTHCQLAMLIGDTASWHSREWTNYWHLGSRFKNEIQNEAKVNSKMICARIARWRIVYKKQNKKFQPEDKWTVQFNECGKIAHYNLACRYNKSIWWRFPFEAISRLPYSNCRSLLGLNCKRKMSWVRKHLLRFSELFW